MLQVSNSTKKQDVIQVIHNYHWISKAYHMLTRKAIKYLGITLNPWSRICKISVKEIADAERSVKNLKLKPHQKVNLIRTYLLPRYIHKLVANSLPLGTLEQIDHEIKQIIKEILHLHSSITDGIIYINKNHGGLGVQRVANIVKLAKIRNKK